MMSTQREKLIELLMQDPELFFDKMGKSDYENLADYLLANGVVVLPCRCGECEYHDNYGRYGSYVGGDVHYCTKLKFGTRDSEFCPYGKTKRR